MKFVSFASRIDVAHAILLQFMNSKPSFPTALLASIIAATTLIPTTTQAGGGRKTIPMPDLTKGEAIPQEANHTWTLGATGARGWMYPANLGTSQARQIAITKINSGSPADGVLKVGDVVLGIGKELFSYDARVEFGKALTQAESDAGKGKLTLLCWREGKTQELIVKLPVMGTYSATAPYNCAKSKRILEQGCEALAKRVEDPAYNNNPISRSLNALALLASGEKKYLPIVRKEVNWAKDFQTGNMATWYYGYVIMLLSEYVMATGDDSVMPGLERLCLEAAEGQSNVGSWGHKFATPDGRLMGYGMMNAPGVPLTISMAMGRAAGVKDPKVAEAIERSAKLLRFYIGKGAVPYGDHGPWIQNHEDNGKCGMAAVLFNLLKEPEGATFFSRMSLASHGPERDTGHTGNFWNMTWAMPAVTLSGPQASGAWMKEFGAWYFDLARQSDTSFPHQGPPQINDDSTGGWDATGAYLLAYAMPLKKLMITGKQQPIVPQLSINEANQVINDGRGWSSNDRNSAYDAASGETLIECLGSWSPIIRERAAIALARKKISPEPLIKLLGSPSLETRLGACQALEQLKAKAAPAVPALRKTLKSEHLWLRIKATDALAAIGAAAAEAAPELLEMITREPTVEDPRGMEQRFICYALFQERNGLLFGNLGSIDSELLKKAIRAGLQNQDGRARSCIAAIYPKLTPEQLKPLMPDILKAVQTPAPSGEMFADGIRVSGLQILAQQRIKQGIESCVNYIATQNPWGSEKRTVLILKILLTYGAQAQPCIPQLESLAADFDDGEPNFPRQLSKQKANDVREAIKTIQASTEKPELIDLR